MANFATRLKQIPLLVWVAIGVLVVALGLRLIALDQFPPGVQHDEVFVANFGETVLGGQFPIFFELNRGNEPLFMYLVAGMFKLFGENVWALRATAGLCGFGALLLTYLLVRDMFGTDLAALSSPGQVVGPPTQEQKTKGNFIALVTVAAAAVSFWSLYESRIGLHAISTYLLAAATFYVFWRGWTRGNRWLLLLSGVLAGAAMYTYRSGIFVPATLLLFVGYTLIFHRKVWGKNIWLAPVIFVIAALVYAPLFYFITAHPDSALARIGDLSSDLDTLRQGNPVPIITDAARVFGMFGISGDPEWRYNVALRPIFDPLWAILFYAGIVVALWRFKRPPYAFAVIWLLGMLLPSILSGSDLSQHRAVGAIGAAFIMPALTLDEIRVWVTARWAQRGRIAMGVGVAALLLLAAFGGLNAYFVTWANNPEVRSIQRADLMEAAHWLDAHQGDDRALVSAEFANDLDRGSFNLEAATQRHTQFFNGGNTFVLPAQGDAYVINTRTGQIDPTFQKQFLQSALVYQVNLPDGTPEVQIYKLTQQDFTSLMPTDAKPLAQTQDGQISIVNAVVPEKAETGTAFDAQMWWRIGAPQVTDADGLIWDARLTNHGDYVWDETTGLGYTPSQWQPNDTVVSLFPLNVPPDMPSDFNLNNFLPPITKPTPFMEWRTGVQVALDSGKGVVPMQDPISMTLESDVTLGHTAIVRGDNPQTKPDLPIRYPSKAMFGNSIRLLGSDAVGDVAAGGVWRLVLFWQTAARLPKRYTIRLTATDEKGKQFAQQQGVLSPQYPTEQWGPGDYVRTIQDFKLPDDAPRGKATIHLSLWSGKEPIGRAEGVPIAGIVIGGRTHNFDKPVPQTTLDAQFGDAMQLIGYDLAKTSLKRGDTLDLKLDWHALQPADKAYTVFVHLLDANGQVVGQLDSPPLGGDAPTDSWQKDEYLTDPYRFQVNANAPTGAASLEIGVYDPASGQRLPVTDAAGKALGDHLAIPGLQIQP